MTPPEKSRGVFFEVLTVFLKLGLTSFGGPVAHIGYFRRECVNRRQWLSEKHFAELIAYCQCLPGPTSSQLGFLLGLQRQGALWGALAAWLGFTLPSVFLLLLCATFQYALPPAIAAAVTHGLGLVAVAVVAQAVVDMGRSLAPDWPRRAVACVAAVLVFGVGGGWIQLLALAGGAVFGLVRGTASAAQEETVTLPLSRHTGWMALGLFFLLLILGLVTWPNAYGDVFAVFAHAGSLVFGGGHVVLPLLQQGVTAPGWMGNDVFMQGYGLAQAMPGPLFSLAAYLGAVRAAPPNGVVGALLALLGLFLPGLAVAVGVWPFWQTLRRRAGFIGAIAGINAAVVGVLLAALCRPVITTAIHEPMDAVLAASGFAALVVARVPPLVVAGVMVAAEIAAGWAG